MEDGGWRMEDGGGLSTGKRASGHSLPARATRRQPTRCHLPFFILSALSPPHPRSKLLVVELWGIGDLVMASGFLRAAVERYDVTVLGKPHARSLLEPGFPGVKFIAWDAPWTAFTGKYQVWRWRWPALLGKVRALRRERFDCAVSVRRGDARDHLLTRLAGARERHGFPRPRARALLNRPIALPPEQHIAEDWMACARALGLPPLPPGLPRGAYAGDPEVMRIAARTDGRPLVCLHVGARIPVRRWAEASWVELLRGLRAREEFDLLLIPDPDGYGRGLAPHAERLADTLTLPQLVGVLARCDLLLCNDSAPGHLAAAVGTPVSTVFGPTDPVRYRPWGDGGRVQVLIRDICPHRPCFDYCRFPEPICLTRLAPAELLAEAAPFVARHLHAPRSPDPALPPVALPCIAASIATLRRPAELARALASLAAAGPELRAVFICDNDPASDSPAATVVSDAARQFPDVAFHRLAPGVNLGVGGGLARAMAAAQAELGAALTHHLILDDDAILPIGSPRALAEAIAEAGADAACPLVEDGEGKIGWFPRILDPLSWQAVKRAHTPEEYLATCGPAPRPFSWSTFVCLLVTGAAVREHGLPRTDFWVRGEDLEYSLRLTARRPGVFVPAVRVRHLPPDAPTGNASAEGWKVLAMLQNSAFLGSRVPHAHVLLQHLPGNVARFLVSPAGGIAALGQVARALWNGLVRGRPAGAAGADQFHRRALGNPAPTGDGRRA